MRILGGPNRVAGLAPLSRPASYDPLGHTRGRVARAYPWDSGAGGFGQDLWTQVGRCQGEPTLTTDGARTPALFAYGQSLTDTPR